jgi:septal ring factor EnvC (AmiA/AmiB activator)
MLHAKREALHAASMQTCCNIQPLLYQDRTAPSLTALLCLVQDHKAWAVVRHLRRKIADVDESLRHGPERQRQFQEALDEKEQELRDLEAQSARLVCTPLPDTHLVCSCQEGAPALV